MAIKLIGVPGRKVLADQAEADTHDFILIDGPVFFVRDPMKFQDFIRSQRLTGPARDGGSDPQTVRLERERRDHA